MPWDSQTDDSICIIKRKIHIFCTYFHQKVTEISKELPNYFSSSSYVRHLHREQLAELRNL